MQTDSGAGFKLVLFIVLYALNGRAAACAAL